MVAIQVEIAKGDNVHADEGIPLHVGFIHLVAGYGIACRQEYVYEIGAAFGLPTDANDTALLKTLWLQFGNQTAREDGGCATRVLHGVSDFYPTFQVKIYELTLCEHDFGHCSESLSKVSHLLRGVRIPEWSSLHSWASRGCRKTSI